MTLDESQHSNDQVVENNGIKLVYGSELEPYVRHSTVDYFDWVFARGFIVKGAGLVSC